MKKQDAYEEKQLRCAENDTMEDSSLRNIQLIKIKFRAELYNICWVLRKKTGNMFLVSHVFFSV